MTAHPSRAATDADLARIAQFNRTETTFPDNVTLQELIEAQMDKQSSETAVICDHDKVFGVPSFTYAQINDRVNQLAHSLRAAGVRPGHIVALIVERSFAMIIGILGIVKAGGAYLPVSPDNPPDRIDYILGPYENVEATFPGYFYTDAGTAYVYDLASPTPTVPVATLTDPRPATSASFGYSVAVSGTRVVVGVPVGGSAGTAHVYDLAIATPSASVSASPWPWTVRPSLSAILSTTPRRR